VMLVLSRRPHEKVIFPTVGISIDIRRITRGRVTLAIAAPRDIPIYRHEILKRPARELANRECRQWAWSI
jgi:two-component system, OmpR family, response regulator